MYIYACIYACHVLYRDRNKSNWSFQETCQKNHTGNYTIYMCFFLLLFNIAKLTYSVLFYYQDAHQSDVPLKFSDFQNGKKNEVPLFASSHRSTLLIVFLSMYFLLAKKAFWLAWKLNMLPWTFYDLIIRNKLLHDLCYLMQVYCFFYSSPLFQEIEMSRWQTSKNTFAVI